MRFRRHATKLVALGALAFIALGAAPAQAAGNHGISGTVYSPCSGHVWFTSTNARTKAGTGVVKAEFSEINPGGLAFKLLGQSNQQYGSVQQWSAGETNIWRTFISSMANGTVFFNSFKELDGQCGHSDYNFTGTEYY